MLGKMDEEHMYNVITAGTTTTGQDFRNRKLRMDVMCIDSVKGRPSAH